MINGQPWHRFTTKRPRGREDPRARERAKRSRRERREVLGCSGAKRRSAGRSSRSRMEAAQWRADRASHGHSSSDFPAHHFPSAAALVRHDAPTQARGQDGTRDENDHRCAGPRVSDRAKRVAGARHPEATRLLQRGERQKAASGAQSPAPRPSRIVLLTVSLDDRDVVILPLFKARGCVRLECSIHTRRGERPFVISQVSSHRLRDLSGRQPRRFALDVFPFRVPRVVLTMSQRLWWRVVK